MRYTSCRYLVVQGVWEKKFTQEILNKILSFWCTRLIFTWAHRKVGRSAWWRFHSNRLTLLALAELWKKCVKIAYFVRLRIATENSSHALSPLQKKMNARASNLPFQSTFEFAISHELWSRRGEVTPHHTVPMPRWSDRRQHFGHCLISRKLALRCGVVASLARPIPIGLFPSGYVKAKAYTCPWATNSYRIQDCYRQWIAEISTDQCRRTVDHYRHFRFLSFLHISLKSHQSW